MVAIGFRVEPKKVHFVVLKFAKEAKTATIIFQGNLKPPESFTEPESLKWYRNRILQDLETYKPSSAGLRFPEVFGRRGVTTSDHRRLRIEGVILEALAERGIKIFCGALKQISSAMNTGSAKAYKEKEEVRGVSLANMNDSCKEAVLAAMASMEQCDNENS